MIKLTNHYMERYKKRISKSRKDMQLMTDKAFEFGINLDELQNIKIKKELKNRCSDPYTKCKIYRGYVWWFSTAAITVYPMPVHNKKV